MKAHAISVRQQTPKERAEYDRASRRERNRLPGALSLREQIEDMELLPIRVRF